MKKIYLLALSILMLSFGVLAQPSVSAPTPPVRNASDVVSILSDAYTTTAVSFNNNPNWGQSTQLANFTIGADNMNKYSLFNYQGTEFNAALDVSSMEYLHLDIWTTDCTNFDMFLINLGPTVEQKVAIPTILNGWKSIDIPLTSYNLIALSNIRQFKFESTPFAYPTGSTTVYVDNVYFWKAANTPTLSNFTIPTQINTNPPFTLTAPTSNSAGAFTYTSSNPSVATISGNTVTITGVGTSTITAIQAANGAFGAGSISATLTVNPAVTSPAAAAPTPNVAAANVISMFSNAYTNVPVDTWLTSWSAANIADVQIAGNDTKVYSNLNFAGVETTGANFINGTDMQFYHIDVWTANATTFRVKLVDFGANAAFGGGDDVEHELVLTPLNAAAWNSFDIPLSNFTGLTTKEHLAQMIFSAVPVGAATVYVDNIYFYKNAALPTVPTVAAPIPSKPAANVISMFSNTYTNVPVDTWLTGWSAANIADVQIAGNDTKVYTNLNFAGVETVASQINATTMEYFHIDAWTPNATTFRVKLVDVGANGTFGGGDDVEHEVVLTPLNQGTWNSYDIPLSNFTGLTTRAHIAQLIFSAIPVGSATVYVDNVYFYKLPPTTPLMPAATPPVRAAADVISIFSDAYTNIIGTDFNPNWGQTTQVSEVNIQSNPTKKYDLLNYQGTQLAAPINLTTFQSMHIDVWTPNCTSFKVFLVNTTTGGEQAYTITPSIAGWNSIDIPLTAYSTFVASPTAIDISAISQLKYEAVPFGTSTVFVDNLYFYKNSPAPVKLSSFEAKKDKATSVLNWTTSLESNNKGFHIERSTNGSKWNTIQFVNGIGNSTINTNYNFTDLAPNKGVNYYRLKQEDFDGKFEYTDIKVINFSSKTDLNVLVFPNPTSDRIYVDVTKYEMPNATIKIINAEGKIVLSKTLQVINNYFNQSFNVSNFAKGVYFVKIENNKNTLVSKSFIIE